ncbi:hypothetical protein CIT25_13860 [Mesorhizobium mediterraneum]|uniref:Uncharacterized protein n=1 Tax=Mesorhizobium mediterraneum TaxID=43617 RepID=A0AB36RAL7_9HYPH|nr:hypothetical protein CIT25_13860 [Mesorhizobium mediterraneum]
MANWIVGDPFQGIGPNAMAQYLGPRTILWAIHAGAPNVTITYLYMMEAEARRCVANGNFTEMSSHYRLTRRLPCYGGPYPACDWWLALPSWWCEEADNFANPDSLRNAQGFPVVAWGRVTLPYDI